MTHNRQIAVDARMLCSSGIGTYLQNTLPRIIERSDWHFVVLGDVAALEMYGCSNSRRCRVVPYTVPIYTLGQQWSLPRSMPRDIDVFWTPHYDFALGVPGKLVATVHDVGHLALPQVFRGIAKRTYATVMLQALRLRAVHIMFVSAFSRDEFHNLVGKPRAETVVYNGVNDAWKSAPWRDPPQLYPRPYMIYVGNVKPHKNLKTLLAAFQRIAGDVPHDLVIVGKREGFLTGEGNFGNLISALGSRVVFTGRLSDDEVKRYVAQASLLVLPSLYEGFGLPPLEAMAAGCPVAVSRSGSLPEVCGDAAIYFDPLDAAGMAESLRSVLTDMSLADQLRVRGKVQVSRYSWDSCADKIVSVMSNLLIGPSHAAGD